MKETEQKALAAIAVIGEAMKAVEALHVTPEGPNVFDDYQEYKQVWNRLYYSQSEMYELLDRFQKGTREGENG